MSDEPPKKELSAKEKKAAAKAAKAARRQQKVDVKGGPTGFEGSLYFSTLFDFTDVTS